MQADARGVDRRELALAREAGEGEQHAQEEGGGDRQAHIVRDEVAQHLDHDQEAAAPADDEVDDPQRALGQKGHQGHHDRGDHGPRDLRQEVAGVEGHWIGRQACRYAFRPTAPAWRR